MISYSPLGEYLEGSITVGKWINLLNTQIYSKTYIPDFGIDTDFFTTNSISFQNETFTSYLKQEGIKQSILVTEVTLKQEEFKLIVQTKVESETVETAFSVGLGAT